MCEYFPANLVSLKDMNEAINMAMDDENDEVAKEIEDVISLYNIDDSRVLISDDYFGDYIRDDLHSNYHIPGFLQDFIDYDRLADWSKQDYTLITIDGSDYWLRS